MQRTDDTFRGTVITVVEAYNDSDIDEARDIHEEHLKLKTKFILIVEWPEDYNKSYFVTNDEGFELCCSKLFEEPLINDDGNIVLPTTEDIVQLWKEWQELPTVDLLKKEKKLKRKK